MDLTTIEKPFGLLDRETQTALEKAEASGAEIQSYVGQVGWGAKLPAGPFYMTGTYRVRPTPRPPAIELPWDVIDPRWKWAAMDESGEVWLYGDEPNTGGGMWLPDDGCDFPLCIKVARLFTGIRINVTDWRESLTRRPK